MDQGQADVVGEVRTQRLVIVYSEGIERAIFKVHLGHVELQLVLGRENQQCEVLCFGGEQEPGMFLAGVEIWAHGESLGGCSMIRQGDVVELRKF